MDASFQGFDHRRLAGRQVPQLGGAGIEADGVLRNVPRPGAEGGGLQGETASGDGLADVHRDDATPDEADGDQLHGVTERGEGAVDVGKGCDHAFRQGENDRGAAKRNRVVTVAIGLWQQASSIGGGGRRMSPETVGSDEKENDDRDFEKSTQGCRAAVADQGCAEPVWPDEADQDEEAQHDDDEGRPDPEAVWVEGCFPVEDGNGQQRQGRQKSRGDPELHRLAGASRGDQVRHRRQAHQMHEIEHRDTGEGEGEKCEVAVAVIVRAARDGKHQGRHDDRGDDEGGMKRLIARHAERHRRPPDQPDHDEDSCQCGKPQRDARTCALGARSGRGIEVGAGTACGGLAGHDLGLAGALTGTDAASAAP